MPSISYFNVRGTYTGDNLQKLKTKYVDLERGAEVKGIYNALDPIKGI